MKTITLRNFMIFIVAFIGLNWTYAKAQSIIDRPDQYFDRTLTGRQVTFGNPPEKWLVIVNRPRVRVFTDAACTTPGSRELRMNETLGVLENPGDKGLSVKVVPLFDPQGNPLTDAQDNLISGANSHIGYVRRENVVLWKNCLRSETIINNSPNLVLKGIPATNESNAIPPRIYSSPKASDNPGDFKEAFTFEYNFVYDIQYNIKDNSTFFLIGKRTQLDLNEKPQNGVLIEQIKGWIDTTSFTVWNNNIGLEPVWDAVEINRIKSGKYLFYRFPNDTLRPAIYSNYNINTVSAGHWRDEIVLPEVVNNQEVNRWVGNQARYLLLAEYPQEVKKVGVVTKNFVTAFVLDKKGKPVIDTKTNKQKTYEKELDDITFNRIVEAAVDAYKQFRVVNLVFLIDGTQSMSQHIAGVVNGLRNAIKIVQENPKNKDLTFMYSYIVFQDGSDEQCAIKAATPILNLNTFGKDLSDVAQQVINNPCFDTYRDHEEPLFYAMNKVFTRVFANNPNPKNSNFLFVIGDAGDRSRAQAEAKGATQYITSSDTVISKLAKNNFSIIGIQANRRSGTVAPAYVEFENQLKKTIENTARTKYDNSNISLTAGANGNLFELTPVGYGASRLRTTNVDVSLTIAQVQDFIEQSLAIIDNVGLQTELDLLVKKLAKELQGQPGLQDLQVESIRSIINLAINSKSKVFPLTAGDVKQVFSTRYIAKKIVKKAGEMPSKVFNETILLSTPERKNIDDALKLILPNNTDIGKAGNADIRTNIQKAWHGIIIRDLKLFPNSTNSKTRINAYTLAELSYLLTGYPGKKYLFSDGSEVKLLDISQGGREPNILYEYQMDWLVTKYAMTVMKRIDKAERSAPEKTFFAQYSKTYEKYAKSILEREFETGLFNWSKWKTPPASKTYTIEPAKVNALIKEKLARFFQDLPAQLGKSFYNLDKTAFFIPPVSDFGALEHEWVDARIFPQKQNSDLLKALLMQYAINEIPNLKY